MTRYSDPKLKWVMAAVAGILFIIGVMFSTMASSYSQRIVNVHDGDTFYTQDGRTIRLVGIDCPELGQEYGPEAKKLTQSLVWGREVRIVGRGKDIYGRELADVYIGDVWVNKELVVRGLAWVYKRKDNPSEAQLYPLEQEARTNHLGLWNGHEIPPFIYRKQH